MDEVAENSDDLMERYLEGEEISHDEIVSALKEGVTAGTIFPVTCGVATKNLGTDRLLDALVSDLPSPAKKGAVAARDAEGNDVEIEPDEDGDTVAYVFKTLADPFAGRINLFRVYSGHRQARLPAHEHARALARSASASCSSPQRQGDGPRGRVRRRATSARSRSSRRPTPATCCRAKDSGDLVPAGRRCRRAVMAFAIEPKSKGDEEKVGDARCAACRRRTRRSTSTATRRPASRSSPASRRCTSR